MKKITDIREALRQAIRAYPHSMLQLEKESGCQRGSIARFLAGERDLRLETAAKLAMFFELELRKREE